MLALEQSAAKWTNAGRGSSARCDRPCSTGLWLDRDSEDLYSSIVRRSSKYRLTTAAAETERSVWTVLVHCTMYSL